MKGLNNIRARISLRLSFLSKDTFPPSESEVNYILAHHFPRREFIQALACPKKGQFRCEKSS